MNIQLTPESEIEILRRNVADLQEQLHNAHMRIQQLLMENNYHYQSEILEYITK